MSLSRKTALRLASMFVLLIVILLYDYSYTVCKGACVSNSYTPKKAQGDNKLQSQLQNDLGNRPRSSDEAYVSLLYHPTFFLAARVLGQSIRESGTTRDYVLLCMADVTESHRKTLMEDGWIVRSLGPLPDACVKNTAFEMYYTHFVKIKVWLLTEYRRVVSIDADAIVLHNIDHLFNCAEYCASYRHSDLFNTGVEVLKPSLDTFQDMCKHIQSIGSYTGGDQGFLNYYYEQLKYAPMFSRYNQTNQHSESKFLRLPSEYNSDVSIYYLNNKWMYIDVDEPYVLHYTLGPVKPWKWWSYPLFSLNWRWKSLRDRLPPADVKESSLWDWQSWLPLPLLIALYFSRKVLYCKIVTYQALVRWTLHLAPIDSMIAKFLPTLMLLSACYLAYSHVPLMMTPLEAWTRYGMWVAFYFILPFFVYCHLAYAMGKQETTTATSLSYNRIMIECVFWLLLTVASFCMQLLLPVDIPTMSGRLLSFFTFGVITIVLCHFYGRRITLLFHGLGSMKHSITYC